MLDSAVQCLALSSPERATQRHSSGKAWEVVDLQFTSLLFPFLSLNGKVNDLQ